MFCDSGSKDINFNSNIKEMDKTVTQDWNIKLRNTMKIIPNFISKEEEDILLYEVDPYIKRLHYEYSHWDNVSRILIINIKFTQTSKLFLKY